MATGKVARRKAVSDVAALLDTPEVAALIDAVAAVGSPRGRKGFGTRALVGACLVKGLFALPTWTWVAALIAEHPGLQNALGGINRYVPPKIRVEPSGARRLHRRVRRVAPRGREAIAGPYARGCADLPAYGNGQRYVYQGGPERERYSDPDASWGHRSAVSTRSGGGFYGYKIHAAVCVATGLPLAWRIETGKRQESLYVAPLLDALHARGFRPETCAMDKGYDNTRVHAECEARGVEPIIPLRGAKKGQPALPLAIGGRLFPRIARHTQRFRDLYRGRGAVEREFGRLKHDYGLLPLRVRGIDRVALHADLVILARLALALNRAQAIPFAA